MQDYKSFSNDKRVTVENSINKNKVICYHISRAAAMWMQVVDGETQMTAHAI
jgi:hypothetical protein